ncbi:MAG TPA: tetratricopeptide repeat protein [Terriglobia bacterium]|nr:tetratricopeptide repeat protein [Terriglobia bacterium]
MASHSILSTVAIPALAGLIGLMGPVPAAHAGAAQDATQTDRDRAGSVRLTVAGAAAARVAGASVVIEPAGSSSAALRVSTDRDGTYQSAMLAPGQYRITVLAPCYEKSESSVEITPGKQLALAIGLTPGPIAAGEQHCPPKGKTPDAGFQFSDSGGLKAGALSGAVDAAGYSSQAQSRSLELRQALGEWALTPGQSAEASAPAEADVFARGNALLVQGDDRQAELVFQQGLQRYPRSVKMLLALSVAYYSGGRADDAIESLCQAVDLNPRGRAAYFFLAEIYSASPTRTGPVLQRLQSFAAGEPHNAAAQYYYALCLWRSGTGSQGSGGVERVVTLLQSAVALDPSLVDARFQLGVVLSEAGRDAPAMTEFQKVVAMRPDWAEAHYRLAQLYRRTGQTGKAERELADYERCRKQNPPQAQRLREDLRRLLLGSGGG